LNTREESSKAQQNETYVIRCKQLLKTQNEICEVTLSSSQTNTM